MAQIKVELKMAYYETSDSTDDERGNVTVVRRVEQSKSICSASLKVDPP